MMSPIKKTVKAKVAKVAKAVHSKNNEKVVASKESSRSSRADIRKYFVSKYKLGNDAKKMKVHLKTCLRNGVSNGLLKKVKITDATGNYEVLKPVKKVYMKSILKIKSIIADAKKIPLRRLLLQFRNPSWLTYNILNYKSALFRATHY